MPRSIIHLRTGKNLKMLFLLTSLRKALIKPEDGNFLFHYVVQCRIFVSLNDLNLGRQHLATMLSIPYKALLC